jgi:Spy/CpxP family protein refolding chaperone
MITLRTKKLASLFALIGVLALVAIVGFAQGPAHFGGHGGHGGPGGEGPGEHGRGGPDGGIPFARELNLTDAQKTQIKQIMDSTFESTKALHEQLRQLHDSAPDPLSGAAFDEAAVRATAQKHAAIEVELEVAHARAMSQSFAVLTAEQKAQLAAHHKEMEQRHAERESQHKPPTDN